jgi:hypothetical protein
VWTHNSCKFAAFCFFIPFPSSSTIYLSKSVLFCYYLWWSELLDQICTGDQGYADSVSLLSSKLWFVCFSALFTLQLHAWSIWSIKCCVMKYFSDCMCALPLWSLNSCMFLCHLDLIFLFGSYDSLWILVCTKKFYKIEKYAGPTLTALQYKSGVWYPYTWSCISAGIGIRAWNEHTK